MPNFLITDSCSTCEIEWDGAEVNIRISKSDTWRANDIKQLRKFLKKVQKDLEEHQRLFD